MAGKVIDESKVDDILKSLSDIDNTEVRVGILGNSGRYKGTGESVLDIATIHEFGGDKMPERSFIRATYDTKKSDILENSKKGIEAVVFDGVSSSIVTTSFGQFGEDITREYLIALDSPPLHPQTIKRKGSSAVLIDTGQLSNSISYEVKK